MFHIIQYQAAHTATFTLGFQPNDANYLLLLAENGASPVGCASAWSLVSSTPYIYRGDGPFTGVTVHVTAGRTPPPIDCTIMEIGS